MMHSKILSCCGSKKDEDQKEVTKFSGSNYNYKHPLVSMIQTWIFGIMIPTSAIAWFLTHQWIISIACALAIPFLAIAQGAIGILTFRLYFGNAPTPISPSHGVVQAVSANNINNSINVQKLKDVNNLSSIPPLSPKYQSTNFNELPRFSQSGISIGEQDDPLRLLVIGDSLAIGVGQSTSCTPVLPEVVAKTLSVRLNGRTVYWTCHGASGASTGWVVRELERAGLQHQKSDHDHDERLAHSESLEHGNEFVESKKDYWSDTEKSTSDESTSSNENKAEHRHYGSVGPSIKEDTRHWRERLAQHRKRFEQSEVLGPYDIVVVITGSNDLKSAFFPFLLKGEDAEFRRQAAERGGNYHLELRRLLETLHSRMRRLKSRASSVRETVLKNVEELIIQKAPSLSESNVFGSIFKHHKESDNAPINSISTSDKRELYIEQERENRYVPPSQSFSTLNKFPLVVLPGLPARALPIFKNAPLRWLAVPIVEILDLNKSKIAASDDHNVLFVPSASIQELATFENEDGELWKQKCDEHTILSLHDIQKQDRKKLELKLLEYYSSKNHEGGGKKKMDLTTSFFSCVKLFSCSRKIPGHALFSIDSIHPNDLGYDFWGRYIANAIADKLLQPIE